MPLSSKTRLGTYEILGLLGTGGMGEVYRAKDLRLGREVALKVLPSGVASSSERLARFEREARTVARLNHPNIVTLYSVEDEDGTRFLTMELVEGQRLADLVTPNGLPLARVLELSIPLADALAAAHQRGVIHRDLKPGNVMVTRDGRVKVLDFGLARMTGVDEPGPHETDATKTSPLSDAGQVLGTVPYMAPEQIRGEPADAPADLFALGVILYELAAGRRPFTGATSADVSSSILRDWPEPLTRVRADLPGDLERIVIRCLEKNSRDRAQSALDVSNELRRLRRDLERGAPERYPSDKIASVAVLPFMNRSADAEDEYFSDGLADELLNVLAKVKGLRVPARASSFHFKGKDTPLGEIGRALNVATVLDGSIRKAGNRVRISVQLVKVSDGYHLWSESYDRNLDDIFAVQDDIARSVVSELRRELLGLSPDRDSRRGVEAEVEAAGRGRGASSEAHRLFLQGRFFVSRFNGEDVTKGITYLREAVALDDTHAAAWAALAMAHMTAWGYGWGPATEEVPRAREAASRSLEIQPDLAEGHLAMGTVQWAYDWNWSAAEGSFRRAQELAPNDADAISGVGEVAYTLGRLDEALTLYMLSRDQDPLTAGYSAQLGRIYDAMNRPSEARAAYLKVLELAPQRITTHAFLALTSLNLGLLEEAATEAAKEPDRGFGMMARSIVAHRTGRAQEAEDILADLIKVGATVAAYQIAQTYASRGEKDPAFQWLDRAFAQRDGGMTWMKPDPLLRTLHDDPRWPALLKRMRLE